MEAQINKKIKRIELSLAAARVIFPSMMYNPMLDMQTKYADKIMQKMLKDK